MSKIESLIRNRSKEGFVHTYVKNLFPSIERMSDKFKENQKVSPKKVLFKDVLEMWIDNNQIQYKGATLRKYQTMINTHIIPSLGEYEVEALNSSMINSFLSEKMENGRLDGKGGLSPSYVRTMMIIINSTLNYSVKEELCKPLKSPIHKPVLTKKDLNILSKEDQEKLEKVLFSSVDETKIGILLALYTGLRIGEICALSWDDIDLEKQIISVKHTISRVNQDKNNTTKSKLIIDRPKTSSSNREIPIPSNLASLLKEGKNTRKSNFVVSDKENFISPRTFEYRYHKLLKESDIPSVNFHVLRHTFATRCIDVGVDVKSLSEILGHANVNITLSTYVHSSMEMKRRQLEKLTSH